MRKEGRRREWLIIIGIAVVLHLVLFLSIKPEFFAMFSRSASGGGGDLPALSAMPDAIITLEIEIDESADHTVKPVTNPQDGDRPADLTDDTPSENDKKTKQPDQPNDKLGASESLPTIDIQTLIGDDPEALPYDNAGGGPVKIPPRPVEITWPDTDDLEHCLGHEVDIRIRVDEKGRILRVEPGEGEHPDDCVQAALDSARRIRFEPGRVNGIAVPMWTQIRIDFREKG